MFYAFFVVVCLSLGVSKQYLGLIPGSTHFVVLGDYIDEGDKGKCHTCYTLSPVRHFCSSLRITFFFKTVVLFVGGREWKTRPGHKVCLQGDAASESSRMRDPKNVYTDMYKQTHKNVDTNKHIHAQVYAHMCALTNI